MRTTIRRKTLTALIFKAEQQLGVPADPTPQSLIEGIEMPLSWTTQKPTQTGWYWYRKDATGLSILFYCGTVWDHVVDFAGLNEPVAFMKDHLLEGEWADPLQQPE